MWVPPATRPSLSHRARPPIMEEKISEVLAQLDQEIAEYGALRAEARKTTQERLAREKAAEQQKAGRVTAFGARLDDDVAGDAVLSKMALEEHQELFESGIKLMRRGEYKQAVTAFTRATAACPGGMGERKGGQYAIYLAQALQAAGKKREAVGLLKRCEAHPDADVRKIADNVLYIMNAPELKLEADQFITMKGFEERDDWSASGRRRAAENKDPPPEKYSLEWYVLEGERKRKAMESAKPDGDPTVPSVLAAALLVGTFGYLVAQGA